MEIEFNSKPVVNAARKIPTASRERVKMELDEMDETGIIAKVETPTEWVNSLVVVEKANGQLRLCLDPRDLNKVSKR